jgi:DNA polymerase III delta subunit
MRQISLQEVQFNELLDLLKNPRLFSAPALVRVENLETLAKDELETLFEASASLGNQSDTYIFFLGRLKAPKSLQDLSIVTETLNQQKLTELIRMHMSREELPVNIYLAGQLAERYIDKPLGLFSEIEKLKLFLDPETKNYRIENVLPLFSDPQEKPFGFLDGVGVRKVQRAVFEFAKLEGTRLDEPIQMTALIKSHLQKLLLLKQNIERQEELRLFKLSHAYLTLKGHKRKQVMSEIRDYFAKRVQEPQKKTFSKNFRSDYYLAKLLYQQRLYSLQELRHIISQTVKLQSRYQSTSLPGKPFLFELLLNTCK